MMIQIGGTVKARREWTCKGCGSFTFGDWAAIEVKCEADNIEAKLTDHFNRVSAALPEGWSKFGPSGCYCEGCKP